MDGIVKRIWHIKNLPRRHAQRASQMRVPGHLILILFILGISGNSLSQTLRPKPILKDKSGNEWSDINVNDAKNSDFQLYFDISDAVRGVVGIVSWQIFILDFEDQVIIWSKDGVGTPTEQIAWNGLSDKGDILEPSRKLGVKFILTTTNETQKSEILELKTLSAKQMFRKLDQGFRFSPLGGMGYGMSDWKENNKLLGKYSFFPLLFLNLDFHYYKTHFGGVELHSAAQGVEKFSKSIYSFISLHYEYALINRLLGSPLQLLIGGQVVNHEMYPITASLVQKNKNGLSLEKFNAKMRGGGGSIKLQWYYVNERSLDFFSSYSVGKNKSSLLNLELGTKFSLTNQLDMRIMLGQERCKSNELKIKRSSDMSVLKLYLDIAM